MTASTDRRATTMISSTGPLLTREHDKTVWLIHGFATKGRHFKDIEDELVKRGYKVKRLTYGWHQLLTIWKATRDAAETLTNVIDPGDYAICHSNGFQVVIKALALGAALDKIIAISPAAHSSVNLPAPFWEGSIHVFATQRDTVLRMVNWLKWLPGSSWGDLGRIGYIGTDKRFKTTWFFPVIKGHSKWFLKPHWLCNRFERSWRNVDKEIS